MILSNFGSVTTRDGNRPGWPTGAYGLAYVRPGQARLFSKIEKA